jgi:hypothetical protein
MHNPYHCSGVPRSKAQRRGGISANIAKRRRCSSLATGDAAVAGAVTVETAGWTRLHGAVCYAMLSGHAGSAIRVPLCAIADIGARVRGNSAAGISVALITIHGARGGST